MFNNLTNILIAFCLALLAFWVFNPQNANFATQRNMDNLLLIKDGAGVGRDIYVPQKPKRVVMLSASSFDMWVRLGGGASIVGVSRFSAAEPVLYEQINKEAVIFGPYAYKSPEVVMQLKPDLVIMNGYDGAQDFLGEFLRKNDIPLMTLPGRTVEDTYREIELFGELIGNPEKAKSEVARIKKNIAANREKYSDMEKKKALLIFGTAESFSMFTPYTRQSNMLEMACGENIIGRSVRFLGVKYVPLSLEFAALKNPDHVFFMNHGKPAVMEKKTKEALSESSSWNTIKAVREGYVHVLPPEYFVTNPGLKTDYAINKISTILYEE